jgi:hypothetical protein
MTVAAAAAAAELRSSHPSAVAARAVHKLCLCCALTLWTNLRDVAAQAAAVVQACLVVSV